MSDADLVEGAMRAWRRGELNLDDVVERDLAEACADLERTAEAVPVSSAAAARGREHRARCRRAVGELARLVADQAVRA